MATKKSSKKPVAAQAPPEQAKPAQAGPSLPKLQHHIPFADEILLFLGVPKSPSIVDCEDISRHCYTRVEALLDMLGFAADGYAAGGCEIDNERVNEVIDVIQSQVGMARLAALTLFNLCHNEGQSDASQASE